MKRRTATLLLGSVLAFAPGVARAKDKITVIMSGWDLLFWGTLAASELGYFDAEGIDAEMVRAGGGAKSLAAVAGGNAEFNIGAPASAFRARAKGSDVMMIAPAIAQYTDNVTMSGAWAKKHGLTAASSYEDKLKALKGMTLAVSSIGGGADQLVRFLDPAGRASMPDRDITMTAIPGGRRHDRGHDAEGRIDGFVVPPPAGDDADQATTARMPMFSDRAAVRSSRWTGSSISASSPASPGSKRTTTTSTIRFLRAEQRGLGRHPRPGD